MTSQVNIKQKENKYRVSFPMSNDTIHYSTGLILYKMLQNI